MHNRFTEFCKWRWSTAQNDPVNSSILTDAVPEPPALMYLCCPAACCAWQVVLTTDMEKLGKAGELLTVPIGYWRNFLQPQGFAKVASADILE